MTRVVAEYVYLRSSPIQADIELFQESHLQMLQSDAKSRNILVDVKMSSFGLNGL
jgi:hypothetical protein